MKKSLIVCALAAVAFVAVEAGARTVYYSDGTSATIR